MLEKLLLSDLCQVSNSFSAGNFRIVCGLYVLTLVGVNDLNVCSCFVIHAESTAAIGSELVVLQVSYH